MSADPPDYRVIDIHAQLVAMDENVESSEALGLNAQHEVVGWYDAGSGKRPFIWLPTAAYGLAAGAHDINDVMGLSTSVDAIAYSINDDGLIAGVFDFNNDPNLLRGNANGGAAFVWDISTWDDTTPVTLDITALVHSGSEASIEGVATAISNDDPAVVVGWTTQEVDCDACATGEPTQQHISSAFRLELDDIPNLIASDVEFLPLQVGLVTKTMAYGVVEEDADPTQSVGATLPPLECGSPGFCPSLIAATCENDFKGTPWHWESSSSAALVKLAQQSMSDPSQHNWAFDVNTAGNIVGRGGLFDSGVINPPFCGFARALYWDHPDILLPAVPVDLTDELTNVDNAEATAIAAVQTNNFVYVVGNDLENDDAIVWERDDQSDWLAFVLYDFIDSDCANVWSVLAVANDVTDDLWVAGWGFQGSSDERAYVTAPIIDTVCTADLDGNGCVNGADLSLLLGQWGDCEGECSADLNCDGKVDGADLALLNGQWSGECDCESSQGSPDSQTVEAAEEGSYLPLNTWLLSVGEAELAVQLVNTTGLSE